MYSCGRMLYALAKTVSYRRRWRKFPVTAYRLRCGSIYCYPVNWLMPELHHSHPQRVFVYVYSASVLPGMVPGL